MKIKATIVLLLLCISTTTMAQQAADTKTTQQKYQAIPKDNIEHFGFHRFVTRDKFARQINFYISKTRPSEAKLPLVVCIQGSGSQSVFLEVDTPEGKRIGSGGPEAVVAREFRDRVRVLVVEKPGVEFLKQPSNPGSAEEASEEYNREFSLDRWVEAINASLIATIAMPNIDSNQVLALGHSEGGQVACQLAAINDKVTHVANMAGGGRRNCLT
jgi:predicted peptidase